MAEDLGYESKSKQRTMDIKEVSNGYILRCEVIKTHKEPAPYTAAERYMETEMVVTSLPQLLKKIKTFFEPDIDEEGAKS